MKLSNKEELETLKDSPFGAAFESETSYNDAIEMQDKAVMTEDITLIDTDQYADPILPSDKFKLGVKLGKFVAMMVKCIQTNDEARKVLFPDRPENYFIGKSTEEILTPTTLPAILNYIKDTYFVPDIDIGSPVQNAQVWLLAHFNELLTAAPASFLKDVGLSIVLSKEELSEEQEAEIRGVKDSEIEPYAIENREMPVETKMPQVLKSILSTILQREYKQTVNEDGTITWEPADYVYDRFGIVEFLDRETVMSGLLDGLHTAKNSQEMIDRLKNPNNVSRYPWYPQIAELLETNPELRSVFFKVFRKNKTSYIESTVKKTRKMTPDGNYITGIEVGNFDLSQSRQFEVLSQNIKNAIVDGRAELFTRVKDNALGLSYTNVKAADELLDTIDSALKSNRYKSKINALALALDSIGIKGYQTKLSQVKNRRGLIEYLKTLKQFVETVRNKKGTYLPYNNDAFLANSGKSLWSMIKYPLINMIGVDISSATVYSNGKNYQIYTAPSFLGDLIEGFSDFDNIDDRDTYIRNYINDRFGRSRQTYIEVGNRKVFINSLIQKLYDNPEKASKLKHYVETSAFGNSYSEMNQFTYPLSVLLEYFSTDNVMGFQPHTTARYYVPVMSDKNSAEYIEFEKASFLTNPELAKDELAEDAANIILYEIRRIKEVFWGSMDGSPKIDVYSSDIPENIKEKLEYNRKMQQSKSARKKELKMITFSDILEKGKLKKFMTSGGTGFRFFTFFNNEFIKKTPFAKSLLEYVSNPEDTVFDISLIDTVKALFKSYMEDGFRHSFIPFMQERGFDNQMLSQYLSNTNYKNVEDALEEFYWNSRVMSANILEMTIIDPAFYSDTVQVQKRYAQVHSMTDRVDKTAKFIDNEGRELLLSDGYHRYVIIEDNNAKSEIIDIVNRFYDEQIEKTVNQKEKQWLNDTKKVSLKLLSSIKETDGQAITSIDGYFKKRGMLEVLTPAFKEAYYRIVSGNFNNRDLQAVMQPIKPFVFSWETVESSDNNNFYAPVQIKDSEYALMLVPAMAANLKYLGVLKNDNPLEKIFNIMHDSAYTDGVWNGKGIDTIVFHSSVKGGGYNVTDINTFIEDENREKYIHKHDFYDWGEQQNVPAHLQDHEQAMPSQTRVIVPSNLPENEPVDFLGKKTTIGELRKRYNQAIEKDFNKGIDHVRNLFGMDGTNIEKISKMSSYLKDKLLRDNRTTGEEYRAVSLRNGNFNVPLGDPINMERYISNILSTIKKSVNKELIPGGPVVQISPFGYNEPKIIFDENGHLKHFEVYVTFPSEELERKMTPVPSDKIWKKLTAEEKKFALAGLPLSVERGLELNLISNDDLKAIASRIPVEAKYSIWPMKIKAFLPRIMGEYAVIPKEIVALSGGDFDIDKIYMELKYTKNKGNEMSERALLKNFIVEAQYAFLTSDAARIELFTPQDISPLKQDALDINPMYKEVPYDMTMPEAQFYFQNQNMVGKKMVAVSASTNVAHAMGTMTNVGIKVPHIGFNGMFLDSILGDSGFAILDPIISSYDGSAVVRTTGMFFCASTGNAKDPIVANVGYKKETANIYTGLIRLGVSKKTVALLMSQPIVQKMIAEANITKKSFASVLRSKVADVCKRLRISEHNVMPFVTGTNILDQDLLNNLRKNNEEYNDNLLLCLYVLQDTMKKIFTISEIYKFNSTQNAVGPSPWKTLRNMFKITEIKCDLQDSNNYMSFFKPGTYNTLIEDIPFLQPLVDVYTGLVPELMEPYFPAFSPTFIGLLQFMYLNLGISIVEMSEMNIRNLFKEFTVWYSTGLFEGKPLVDGSLNNRKRMYYDIPLEIMQSRVKFKNGFLISLSFNPKASKKANIPALKISTASMNSETRQNLMNYWTALVNPQSPFYSTTAEISDKLFEYNIFRSGFYFSPAGFMSLVPNRVKNTYKNGTYAKLSDAENWNKPLSSREYFNFLQQYVRNHQFSFTKTIDAEDYVETESGINLVDSKKVSSSSIGVFVPSLNAFFVRVSPCSMKFKRTDQLGFNLQGFEYNRLESGISMKTARDDVYYKKILDEYYKYNA